MTRFSTKSIVSVFTLGLACLCVADANACPRSGGSYSRSSSYSYSRPSYQTYSQPSYSQPVIRSTSVVRSTPVNVAPVQQPAPQQPINQQPPQGQPIGQPQTPQGQPISQPQAPEQGSAQRSALQMLADFGGDATPPAATPVQPQGFTGIGTWTATLSNNATVTLQMQADGRFVWTADANGKQSTFQGTFTLADNSLTLARTNDSQKLAGSITINGDSFTFKLTGSNDAGLTFTRS